jgi:hypothetical protein
MPKTIKEESVVRELDVRKCDSYGNYEIYLQGGGAIPAELRGIYTGPTQAHNRLAAYRVTQGIIDEAKKLKEEIKSISKLDHTYDEV